MSDLTRLRPARTEHLSQVPYLPGLDGLRAIAVAAVLVYHANSAWLSGGFLGVEVFFVISGYLITLLLMAERERTDRVDIVAFWGRRARRLLPALFAVLFMVLTYTWVFEWDSLGRLRGDFLGGVFYVSNWYQIWVGQAYGSSADFSPLRHLWSLAVEEQFYLVWPIVMVLLLRRNGTRNLGLTARWLVLAALIVTVVTAVFHFGDSMGTCVTTPDAYWTVGERCISKPNFLYLSTITRSSGLMLGAAMAMMWRPVAIMRGPLRSADRSLDLLAIVALAGLGLLVWRLDFHPDVGTHWLLFRGGFLLASIATLVLIAAVTHPYTLAARWLGARPIVWVGTRSYGLYLYSWPIFEILRDPSQPGLDTTQFAIGLAATIVIAELSYRLIELPVRRREFGRWYRGIRRRRDPVPRMLFNGVSIGCVVLLALGSLFLSLADIEQTELQAQAAENADSVIDISDLLPVDEPVSVPVTSAPAPVTTVAPDPAATTTTTTTTTTLPLEPISYLAIGDSVMLGAADRLTERGYTVDAQQSRQLSQIVPVIQQLVANDLITDTPIIIHLGTNGTISEPDFDALLDTLGGFKNVILLNVRANRSWTARNNALIAAADNRPNVIVIDWATKSYECTGSCFASDGIHLSSDGITFYANMIREVTGR